MADQMGDALLNELAAKTVGYCGADLKGLCTEASMRALRRAYPQIYDSNDKLLVDATAVHVERRDFMSAFAAITPASHRSAATHARPLPKVVEPLLEQNLASLLQHLEGSFPPAAACRMQRESADIGPLQAVTEGDQHLELVDSDEEESGGAAGEGSSILAMVSQQQQPRILLCGPRGAGQGYLGPALLHALEGLPVHALGLPTLLADASSRSPEEALVHAFMEACRAAPAILYLPHLQMWWETAHATLRATLWMLLAGLAPDLPLLLLTTADVTLQHMDPEALLLFSTPTGSVAQQLEAPDSKERSAFFAEVCAALASPPAPRKTRAARLPHPQLPRAPEAVAAEAAAAAEAAHRQAAATAAKEETAVRRLRMTLREIATMLLCNRRWQVFAEPVHPEDDPEYWQRVERPMDIATLLAKVDSPGYPTAASFLEDVELIPHGIQQRWRDDPEGLRPCSRARALRDEGRNSHPRQDAAGCAILPGDPQLQVRQELPQQLMQGSTLASSSCLDRNPEVQQQGLKGALGRAQAQELLPLRKSPETLLLEAELLEAAVARTSGQLVSQLEGVHAALVKVLRSQLQQLDRRKAVDVALTALQNTE
ncbi:hypothetical protein WJX84_011103 [Apatococcus fuscideae]|uniref:Bromo domain-containing protein n=1 Tax=Apatococcus fuscideae TaxID=2026836 RepID=A0AAW1SZE4_9CHLO